MKFSWLWLVPISALFLFLSGCTTPKASNSVYGGAALTSATRTIEAVIVSKRSVQVDASKGVGASSGGALGAIGGSSLGGSGRDNAAGAVVGAVIGATVGAALDSKSSTIDAIEYIVKSDVAGLLTILQTDGEFQIGQKVYVIMGTKPVLVKAQ